MKFLPSAVQKLSSEQTHRQTDGQTDTQTDTQTRLKLLPTAYADGNYWWILEKASRTPYPTHMNQFTSYLFHRVGGAMAKHCIGTRGMIGTP